MLLLLFPQENVNRLKAYKSNLVVFPRARNAKKPKVGRAGLQEPSGQEGDSWVVICSCVKFMLGPALSAVVFMF